MSSRTGGRSLRLDALRGTAATMVVGVHANSILAAGPGVPDLLAAVRADLSSGVELFFALSGYLVGGPYVRALVRGTPLPSTRAYALRRAARILPGYLVFLALVALVVAPSSLPAGWRLLSHVVLLHGVVPGEVYTYGDVTWTLSIEALFYVAVPLVAHLVRRRVSGPLGGRAVAAALAGAWVVSAVLDVAVAGAVGETAMGNLVVAGLPGTLCLFCPGLLVACAEASLGSVHRLPLVGRRPRAVLLAALPLWLVSAVILDVDGGALGIALRNQVAAVVFGTVLAATLALRPGRGPLRATRVAALVGTVSYGLYLWHWLVARLLVSTGHSLPAGGTGGWAVGFVLLLALSLPLAALSWVLVERRPLAMAARSLERSRSAASSTAAAVTAASPPAVSALPAAADA